MATRLTDALELVARARRVGWDVEQINGGVWKVRCPNRKVVQVHQTPSDVRSHNNVVAELKRNGLDEAERLFAEQAEADRLAKLEADRLANERRVAKVAKRAAALTQAAGPYAPAQVTIDDILADHPAPLAYHRVLVTPAMANALLDRNQPTSAAPWPNRTIRLADVTEWSAILRSGRWRYTHQGVALDTDGRLQDGQHRLTAIAETGVAAEMMVSVGMPHSNFSVIDSGRRRSAAQVLHTAGAPSSAAVAAATRLLHLHQVWGTALLNHTNGRIANDIIADTFAKLDDDDLADALAWAVQLRREVGSVLSGSIAAFYLILQRLPEDDARVAAFVEALVKGVDPGTSSAVYAQRRALTRASAGTARKLNGAEQLALIVKGWNLHAQGRSANTLVVRSDSPMPEVFLPPPGGD